MRTENQKSQDYSLDSPTDGEREVIGGIMRSSALVLCFALSTAQMPAFDYQKGPLDILAEHADSVVIGEMQTGQQAGRSVTLVLSVVRAIKGDLAEGALLDVSGEVKYSQSQQFSGKVRGLWFLKQAGSRWTILPVIRNPAFLETGAFVPFLKTTPSSAVMATLLPEAVGDKVALEMTTSLMKGYAGRAELNVMVWAFSMLGSRPFITDLLRTLRSQSDPELRFIGLAGLLRTADQISALAEIADNAALIPKLQAGAVLIPSLCGIVNPDPGVVSSLGRLASYPVTEACAASALALIHTRETLPSLALLLDSKDLQTREHAIRGLSRFVDNLPIPERDDNVTGKSLIPRGRSSYRTAETDRFSLSRRLLLGESDSEYLQFWKLWWSRMQDGLERESTTQSVK